MNTRKIFIQAFGIIAILSLLLVALAPVIYVFAPLQTVQEVQNSSN